MNSILRICFKGGFIELTYDIRRSRGCAKSEVEACDFLGWISRFFLERRRGRLRPAVEVVEHRCSLILRRVRWSCLERVPRHFAEARQVERLLLKYNQ